MEEIKFENLPTAVSTLLEKVGNIERLLSAEQQHPVMDRPLTIKEASVLINLAVPTIYKLVQNKEIPVAKRGKRLYFSASDLIEWIKEGKRKTVKEINIETEKRLFKGGNRNGR